VLYRSLFLSVLQDESEIAIMSTSAKELILDIFISLFDFEIMRANIDYNLSKLS